MEHYYLTPERLEELKKSLEEMKTAGRLEIAERLQRAKELGDLSENSEYKEAKEAQEQLERKIIEVEHTVKNAVLIQKPQTNKEIIQIGSTIEVSKDAKTMRFTIVGSKEARPEAGFISNSSPLGKAFLGKKQGEIVKIKIPAGEATYKIVKVE